MRRRKAPEPAGVGDEAGGFTVGDECSVVGRVEGMARRISLEPSVGIESRRERALSEARSNLALGALECCCEVRKIVFGVDVGMVGCVYSAVHPCAGVTVKSGKAVADGCEGVGYVGEGRGKADGRRVGG